MKKLLTTLFSVCTLFTGASLSAQQQMDFATQTRVLDKAQSCRTQRQIELARRSIIWVHAYTTRDVKTQLNIFTPDFLLYHVTLSFLAANAGAAAAQLPFGVGPLTKANYLQTIAFLGWSNDVYQTRETPLKVTCLDDNTVTMNLEFGGVQVKRDAQGYITHQLPYVGTATKLFSFDKNGRMARQYCDTDPMFSVELRKKLAQIVAGPPNVQKNEKTRHTYQELLNRYIAQAGTLR